MQHVHHQRSFHGRPISFGQKCGWAAQAGLVVAAFAFGVFA
jgi:hypothetical protein